MCDIKKIGKNVKSLRLQQGWNQNVPAKKLGISVSAFSKIERGVTDIPFSRLTQIATLFNMNIIQLLTFNPMTYEESDILLKNSKTQLLSREADVIRLLERVIELYDQPGQ